MNAAAPPHGPDVPLHPAQPRGVSRAAATFLFVLMAVGSFALWIGVPAAMLWLVARFADSTVEEYLIGLPVTAAAMVAFGAFLAWLNRLYLRVTGVLAYYRAEEEEYGAGAAPRDLGGPLEALLVASLVIAPITLAVWIFGFDRHLAPNVP